MPSNAFKRIFLLALIVISHAALFASSSHAKTGEAISNGKIVSGKGSKILMDFDGSSFVNELINASKSFDFKLV